ncbi:protein mago nashi, partial [Tremellales sp. Uapishka_1]
MAANDLERDPFYLRYYTGHQGMHGHEFLEFEYGHGGCQLDKEALWLKRATGRLRYANNSNYRNDSLIRKEMFVSPAVVEEMKRIIRESEVTKEDDVAWPKKNIVGRQELEVRIDKEHISFEASSTSGLTTSAILTRQSIADGQDWLISRRERVGGCGRIESVLLSGPGFEVPYLLPHHAAL